MDECADLRELLETAALERDGIERLEAGDTPEAARLAGHLAFCPPCAEELARLRRSASTLRAALAGGPARALRERTLAFVRATGVERGVSSGASGELGPSRPSPSRTLIRPPRRPAFLARLAAAAAIILVGTFGAGFLLRDAAGPGAGPGAAPTALARVVTTHARVMAAPDATEVMLADSTGTARGALAIAPSLGEMVVTAAGLPPAPEGSAYGCWVEIKGVRTRLGTMYLAGEVAWWAGPVTLAGPLPPGTRFGVSLAGAGGSVAQPVLLGST